ncbi:unnamed protein product [Prorocentrum cordatum]|uniref:Uncharacterized protein n=1 Tax=Prorocentrum cordatum TaxID=2364126 RepID=A0ABN9W7V0_9DINO|nr:unnamed protein product [Polarella glacialis]
MAPGLLTRLAVCAAAAAAAAADAGAERCSGVAGGEECGAVAEAGSLAHVGLLQHAHSVEVTGARSGVSERSALARAVVPLPEKVAWFHVPKAGSSFALTLLDLPQLCGESAGALGWAVSTLAVESMCTGIWTPPWCGGTDMLWNQCAEQGFFGLLPDLGRSVMGFFRQPEQRLLSDYNYLCPEGSQVENCDNKLAFFQEHQACATKMLTSTESVNGHCMNIPEPTAAQVALAEKYVAQSFAFIGITEEWDLSMCLFNAKFGTPCNTRQFLNEGHGNSTGTTNTWYDTDDLDGFVDKYDDVLYDHARQIFSKELVEFGVTAESCASEIATCGVSTAARRSQGMTGSQN